MATTQIAPHRVTLDYLTGMREEIVRLDANIATKKKHGLCAHRVRAERAEVQADIDAFLKGE